MYCMRLSTPIENGRNWDVLAMVPRGHFLGYRHTTTMLANWHASSSTHTQQVHNIQVAVEDTNNDLRFMLAISRRRDAMVT
jgi:hypothetical protein